MLTEKTRGWLMALIAVPLVAWQLNVSVNSATRGDVQAALNEANTYTDYALIHYEALNAMRDSLIISKLDEMLLKMTQNSVDIQLIKLNLARLGR